MFSCHGSEAGDERSSFSTLGKSLHSQCAHNRSFEKDTSADALSASPEFLVQKHHRCHQ